jgi:hypothetical protein
MMEPVMMMRTLAALALLTLVACGANGAPSAPSRGTGVSFTGDARLGVVVNPNQLEGQP